MTSVLYDHTFELVVAIVAIIIATIFLRKVIVIWFSQGPGKQRGSKVFFPTEFRNFMQYVISTFKNQHEQEFAVLFLSEYQSFKDIGEKNKFSIDPKATDYEGRTFPPDKELKNYVTASPRRNKHAELILLGKLDILMTRFDEDNCKTIVLYTWLLPCEWCKAEIIEQLSPWAANEGKQVILVYTCSQVNEKKEHKIVQDIEAMKILVLKETYVPPHDGTQNRGCLCM